MRLEHSMATGAICGATRSRSYRSVGSHCVGRRHPVHFHTVCLVYAMHNRDIPESMADRLIVALDVPTIERATQLSKQLDGIVSFFKIGLWLLFALGAERFIDTLIVQGKRVFLDAKMYDIG